MKNVMMNNRGIALAVKLDYSLFIIHFSFFIYCLHVHSAVNLYNLAGYIRRQVRSKECSHIRNVFYLACTAQWYLLYPLFADVVGKCLCHCGFDKSGSYCVSANAT